MKYDFHKEKWSMEGLTHAFSIRFDPMPEFIQQEDHIANAVTPVSRDGYAYVSLVTREKLTPNVKITTRCAFEDAAAPLFVLPKNLIEKDGILYYGDYLEVVLWKNGVNVWRMWMENGTVTWKQLLGVEFPVSEGEAHILSVTAHADSLEITADGRKMWLHVPELYPAFHVGINACEGINRFYSFRVSKPETNIM